MAEAALDLPVDEPAVETTGTIATPAEPPAATQPTPILAEAPEPTDVKPSFPDDWREQLSGGDEKLLKELQRFTAPEMLVKSWKETRTKLSSGQYKTKLPDNATDEQKAAWRAENGIPSSVDEYSLDLGEGMVLGEDDMPIAKNFLEHAHKTDMPQQYVTEMLKWYYQFNDGLQQQVYQRDQEFKTNALVELKQQWGPEFQGNLNAIKTLVGDEIGEMLFSARSDDGTLLGDDPRLLKFLAQTAREMYPASTVVSAGGGNNIQTIEAELASLRQQIGDSTSDYWQNPGKQERFMKLLEARDKINSR